MMNSNEIGAHGERLAERFLEQHGVTILARNVHSRYGEIDLIAQEGETLLFIEVKFRQSNHFGSALDSVTPQKQTRFLKTVEAYLQENPSDAPLRIDVIGITNRYRPKIEWIKNAF